ncbi:acyl-CoA oxidase [Hymenopellis radicata]|nr:acyl-CoA oxidase [Hymenopellis radicata]
MQTALDMANARKCTSIDVQRHATFCGVAPRLGRNAKKIRSILEQDPVFDKSQRHFLDRTESFKRGLRLINRINELAESLGWTRDEVNLAFTILDDPLPVGLHDTAFEPVFNSQGSPSLLERYSSLAAHYGIFGCYLQTELGHGSNVAGLETTATFVPETQEFEIHSPTLTSSKWWIGALGRIATHGVLQAKLILPGGTDAGPHLFFIQLRDMDNHQLLPGISAGDIGPKAMAGYASVDNGYARFNHVRIPKDNMLSKFAGVTPDGKYVRPPHAKMSYGGMLYIRAGMVTTAGSIIARAITIAIRYTTVRRQGDKGPDGLERQVLTYPSTYYRLLPIISHAYVFMLIGRNLRNAFADYSERLAEGNTSLLGEMHAILSGLKSYATTTCVADIETARRSMGGHGFSAFAGVGKLYADNVASVTYEGENYVLDKQVVRAVLKAQQQQPTASPSFSGFLRLQQPPLLTHTSWENPETLILLLEWRAAVFARNIDEEDAGVARRLSIAVTEAFIAVQVRELLTTRTVMKSLYLLYLLSTIESSLGDFLELGILRPLHAKEIRKALRRVTEVEILPEAIGLTDAFGWSDWELDSALGVHDGRVYEALWERTKSEPLNNGEDHLYKDYIKPILARGRRLVKL